MEDVCTVGYTESTIYESKVRETILCYCVVLITPLLCLLFALIVESSSERVAALSEEVRSKHAMEFHSKKINNGTIKQTKGFEQTKCFVMRPAYGTLTLRRNRHT